MDERFVRCGTDPRRLYQTACRGSIILTVGLLTFAFSTILGWSYYGERAAEYLFGTKVIIPYRLLWVVAIMGGSVLQLHMVWNFADIANGLMAVPT